MGSPLDICDILTVVGSDELEIVKSIGSSIVNTLLEFEVEVT